MRYALTYPQLMNQALARGLDAPALRRLREAYELTERMTDGLYRAQGQPFLCHLVRTASITLELGQPLPVVMAALLHAAYSLHVFEQSQRRKPTRRDREQLRRLVGDEVEALVAGYDRLPWYEPEALEAHLRRLDGYVPPLRALLVIRLANELEDHLDLGLAYRARFPSRDEVRPTGPLKIELARRLGLTALADELEAAFRAIAAARLPEGLARKHCHGYESSKARWWEMSPALKRYKRLKRRVRAALALRNGGMR
jgi:(p)ppGpp synthase/HD superfamily hydrolase